MGIEKTPPAQPGQGTGGEGKKDQQQRSWEDAVKKQQPKKTGEREGLPEGTVWSRAKDGAEAGQVTMGDQGLRDFAAANQHPLEQEADHDDREM
jgi:hypothetical protein